MRASPSPRAARVRLSSKGCPSRSTRKPTRCPGRSRTTSTTCCQSSNDRPSRLSRRSPNCSPAACAGPSGSRWASTGSICGRHGRMPSEPSGSGSSAPLSQRLSTRLRSLSTVEPGSSRRRRRLPVSPRRRISCRLTSLQPVTARPSTASTSAPATTPACSARLPGAMLPTIGRTCWLLSMARIQKNSRASRKLAIGPAATTAKRCLTLLRLNACSSNAGGTSPSRSSSIFT
ncbi:hypothetical protein D3C80_1290030 [compost metagenome]